MTRAVPGPAAGGAGPDPLLALSDRLLLGTVAALAVALGAAVAWMFAVRARRGRTAGAMRWLLAGALVTVACVGLTTTFLRVDLATRTYSRLPPLPDHAAQNPFGVRLATVTVDGRNIAPGGTIRVSEQPTYLLAGRVTGPASGAATPAGYRYFVLSTNKAVRFARGVTGEITIGRDGSWRLGVRIGTPFCYPRYPSLFTVVMARGATADVLHAAIARGVRRGYLPLADWLEIGHVFLDKKPPTRNLRTCFNDR
jgi:hypothetical protein